MAARQYEKVPIVDAARRCGLVIDPRTLRRSEVEASCPFCGDRGTGKYHLSLNTNTDLYRCNLCNASGNSVTLYARIFGVTNAEAYRALSKEGKVYLLPSQPISQMQEREPASVEKRHVVYSEMISFLTLSSKHQDGLLSRGLSIQRIRENGYCSMPETEQARRLLAKLVGSSHDLLGIPGFYTRDDQWTLAGPHGFLIPVRNKDGLIQGMKIRLDASADLKRKYRWLSSRGYSAQNGTRSRSWIHITGDRTHKRAYLTEGPLKGDVASFLADDALFICTGGVNATAGLREVILSLGVTEVVEAMDMDQMVNSQVRNGILEMRRQIASLPNIRYTKYTWNAAYKGIDDFLLSRRAA